MRDFEGKVAVVTGGASGIGYAMAERFAAEGMKLVLADIEQEALDRAVADLRGRGADAIGHRTDVASYAHVEALAKRTIERFGKVHIICNNAGVSITGPTWMMSLDDWRWVWNVNVWGVVHGIKAFVPLLLDHGEEAHIINTGSLASFNGNGDHAPYCSSKAAVLGISQSLYSEMKAMMTNIGVSIACPGMVATRIHESWRNRPQDDRPWSDREFADGQFRDGSAVFQGRGIAPDAIADSVIEAVKEDRFYVFTGETWPLFLEATLGKAMRGENPRVVTWGLDRRPPEERQPAPWQTTLQNA